MGREWRRKVRVDFITPYTFGAGSQDTVLGAPTILPDVVAKAKKGSKPSWMPFLPPMLIANFSSLYLLAINKSLDVLFATPPSDVEDPRSRDKLIRYATFLVLPQC